MTSQRIQKLKKALARKGWSQRSAAKEIGRTFEHVNRVLQGHRVSDALLSDLEALPAREVAAK
jgi:transcriptional regulator with XRE-family HTH domain